MNPSSPNHFSWHAVYHDPEGFARSLGTENQQPPNSEHRPAYDPDTLRQQSGRGNAHYFDFLFEDEPSGHSQTSAPQVYSQQGETFDHNAHRDSNYSNPHAGTSASAELYSSQQYGHIAAPSYGYASSGSSFYTPHHGTGDSADPTLSHQYPHLADPYAPSGSSYSVPAAGPSDVDQHFTSHRFGSIDDSYNHYQATGFSYPPPLDASSDLPQQPSYHQYDHHSDSFYPTEDQEFPIPTQSAGAGPSSWYHPEVDVPENSPTSSRGDHTSPIVPPSHFQSFDHKRIQELQDSLALPFPRLRPPNFDNSILSEAFKIFIKKDSDTLLRIVRLGESDHILNTNEMSTIFDNRTDNNLLKSIQRLRKFIVDHHIGEIYRPTLQNSYGFKKGQNFHFINIAFEAYSQISKDFGIQDIPLRFVQVLAHLYGNIHISRPALASMVGLETLTMTDRIHDCNQFLKDHDIPFQIKNQHKLYSIVLDEPAHVPIQG